MENSILDLIKDLFVILGCSSISGIFFYYSFSKERELRLIWRFLAFLGGLFYLLISISLSISLVFA